MKTFYFRVSPDGRPPYELKEHFKTLTVIELRKVLEKYPDDMPCIATWEGVLAPIRESQLYPKTDYREEEEIEFIYIDALDESWIEPKCQCLIFNVDEY